MFVRIFEWFIPCTCFPFRKTFALSKKLKKNKIKFADDSHKRVDEKEININRKADDNQAMTARELKDGPKTRDSSLKVSLMDAKKELKCGICNDKFTDPRLLSCLHTFCFNCLRRYIDKGKHKAWFPCPLCNRKIDIPKGGVKVYSNVLLTDL